MEEFDPLIEGTPLHEYLEDIVGISENDVISHQMDPEPREQPHHFSDLPKKTVPNYLRNCADSIIRSRLLLEDDLNLVIQTTWDAVPETNKILYEGSLVSIALLIVSVGIIYVNHLFVWLAACCAVLGVMIIYQYLKERELTKEVSLLLENLKIVLLLIKKVLAEVKVNDEIAGTAQSIKNPDCAQDNGRVSHPQEIISLSQNTLNCLKVLLASLRKAVHDLIFNAPLISSVDTLSAYYALIDSDINENEESCLLSYSIKHLTDIYVVVLSECLRRIALGFYPFLWKSNHQGTKAVQEVIQFLLKESQEAKTILDQLLNSYFYQPQQTRKLMEHSTATDAQVILHQFTTTLRRVLSTVYETESILEGNYDKKETNEKMYNLLSTVESCLLKSTEDLKRAKILFSPRNLRATPQELDHTVEDITLLTLSPTNVETIVDPQGDRVYFGVAEDISPTRSPDVSEVPLLPVRYPEGLLDELKDKLVEKSEEFVERELHAFEESAQREEFKTFLEALKESSQEVQNEPTTSHEATSPFITQQRDLASIIASQVKLKKEVEEETFGDSLGSECEESD